MNLLRHLFQALGLGICVVGLLSLSFWLCLKAPLSNSPPVAFELPEVRAVVQPEQDAMALEALCLLRELNEKLGRLLTVLEKK